MSIQFRCPTCDSVIHHTDVNVATDLAQCPACRAIHKASALVTTTNRTESLTPPMGSKIEMGREISGGIKIFFPSRGIKPADFSQFFFALFWLGFISFWTWGAAHGSIIFAMFSIPFWAVGFAMVFGIINNISEQQIITLDRTSLRVEKKRILWSKQQTFALPEIHAIKMLEYKTSLFTGGFARAGLRSRSRWSPPPLIPAIVAGSGTMYFFESANDAEQEWVVALLDRKLKQGVR